MSENGSDGLTAVPDADVLGEWIDSLRRIGTAVADDAQRIDQLRRLEELKAAAAAAQARLTVAFEGSQRLAQQRAGVPARQVGKGIAAQVGLARRDSPVKGARHLGLAKALVCELPHTMAALARGQISEWRATQVVRETACLTRPDRIRVDAELAARPGGMEVLGDAAIAAEARRIAYRLDPHAFTARAAKAATERCVTLRPAPDTMAYLTALLPVAQGVAAYASLAKAADTARASGQDRPRGQLMADTLVERVTGQATTDAVPLEVNLVMTDHALLDDPDQPGGQEPVEVLGYGPVPAPLARQWLAATAGTESARGALAWLRRLYTSPDGSRLVAMDARRRTFPEGLRRFLDIRDRRCRTPWCDAPIRHRDHPLRAADGGDTNAANGQGLCEACNYAKEATGWRARARPDGTIETIVPTGHRYSSSVPPPVDSHPPPDDSAELDHVEPTPPDRLLDPLAGTCAS